MAYVFLGTLGFGVGFLADLGAWRAVARVRLLLWAASFGLLAYALAMVSLDTTRFWLPGWAVGIGWVLLPASCLLLVYSLFLELPLAKTYSSPDRPHDLVTTGTYALVRHPTVLWYLFVLSSLLLISRSWLLVAAAPLWALLDLSWAVLQERSLLARAPVDYKEYQQRTPFLVPTMRSFKECLAGLFGVGGLETRL